MLGNQTTPHYTQVVFQKVKYLFGYFQKINSLFCFRWHGQMGTRVTGSTTLSTTTSCELLFGHKLTASQNYEERRLVCHFQSHKLSPRLHTFWALAWGRKSVTRGRCHCCVICQRQMWNSITIESFYRISSAMILVLCNTLCMIQNTSLKYV